MITTDRICRFGVLVAVCAALPSGCTSPVEPPPDVVLFGVTLTPETEGFTLQLRITRPDRIQLERDGVAEVVTRFELIGTEFPFPPRLRYDEPILGQEEHELKLGGGELVLTDPCCDGFAYTWLPRLE